MDERATEEQNAYDHLQRRLEAANRPRRPEPEPVGPDLSPLPPFCNKCREYIGSRMECYCVCKKCQQCVTYKFTRDRRFSLKEQYEACTCPCGHTHAGRITLSFGW
jgi:transposase